MKDKKEYFSCYCRTTSHLLVVSNQLYEVSGVEHKDFIIEVNLNDYLGFWKRLVVGIKYIFGFKSEDSAFDTILLNEADCDRLVKLIEEYKKS